MYCVNDVHVLQRSLFLPCSCFLLTHFRMAGGSGTKKRLFEDDEFENVSEMRVTKCAKVHGILSSLSPMKSNAKGTTKYFHGELTDGKKKLRVVGFDAKVHQKLCSFRERNEAVVMSNCEVKENKYNSDLEVVVRKSSDFEKSPTKYDVDVSKFSCDITLNELSHLANFQKVDVRVNVVGESDRVKVKDLMKQEYIIGDATGISKIVAWEDNVGLFVKGGSYKLSGLNVRTFNGKKYLSIARDNFTVIKIDDIGEVKEDTSDLEVQCRITGVKIVGVKFLDVYSGCYACKGKVTAISDILGDCDRCGVTQKIEQCKMYNSARMDYQDFECFFTNYRRNLSGKCKQSFSVDE